jgi:hypothetical protein
VAGSESATRRHPSVIESRPVGAASPLTTKRLMLLLILVAAAPMAAAIAIGHISKAW